MMGLGENSNEAPGGKCRVPGVKEGPRGDLEVAAKLGHFPVPENILGEEREHLKLVLHLRPHCQPGHGLKVD